MTKSCQLKKIPLSSSSPFYLSKAKSSQCYNITQSLMMTKTEKKNEAMEWNKMNNKQARKIESHLEIFCI